MGTRQQLLVKELRRSVGLLLATQQLPLVCLRCVCCDQEAWLAVLAAGVAVHDVHIAHACQHHVLGYLQQGEGL
jgi:hypothetical protein